MAEVSLKNVSKAFGKTLAVDDISMAIPDGAFVVLLGPTGAGKTTTLRLISGLEKLDGGSIHICLLYTSPSPRDLSTSRMPSSA